jgi:hypothetical protein
MMFGWSLVRTSEYEELLQRDSSQALIYRWFAGWRDLDIIWDYINCKNQFTIEHTRRLYAEARGTDEYGKPTREGSGE